MSGFRKFYSEHSGYYDELIQNYKQLIPIRQMQNWLEKRFDISYGNYMVTFSPLIGNPNSTQKYVDNGFSQTVMYVKKATVDDRFSEAVNEILQSNVVFTEIDHNFVNPTSDKYLDEINEAFANRGTWVKEGAMTSIYGTPYGVFNEYMTWAVFSLYCADHFIEEDLAVGLDQLISYMEDKRGFINYRAFNEQLMKIYQAKSDLSIDDLYTEILLWAKEQ